MSENKNITRRKYIEKGVEFGIDLFHTINQSGTWLNIMISPLSVRLALGLTYLAVGPKTKQEMVKTLRLFDDKETNIDMLARTICKYSKSDHVSIGCKLFVQKNLTIKTGALETFGKLSKSAIHRIDFTKADKAAKTINNWVEKKTNNKIKDIVNPGDVADVPFVIVSAIYFSIPWKIVFNSPYDGEFWKNESDSVAVPMMCGDSMEIQYTELPQFKCKSIALPFEDNNHVMIIILPDTKTGIDALEAEISKPGFNFLDFRRGSNGPYTVDVKMPKFSFEYRENLVEDLSKMGMQSALDTPDFSEFFEDPIQDVSISQIIHKTFIKVDENGVEAAAVTVVAPSKSLGVYQFRVSHPFLFAIMSQHNRLLFIGSVRDPSCTAECRKVAV